MKKTMNIAKEIKSNFASGLVVFLVALPLCLGIALASGAPPLSGIISGIIGGIVVGIISNSHVSVSGPAAGLTAIILTAITELGAFELFLCAGIVAGLIQFILGVARAGSISNYFPNNVIEGMLAAIGIIIIIKQIPHALGYDPNDLSSEMLFSGKEGAISGYFSQLMESIHPGAVIITLCSMAVLLVWDRIPYVKNIKLLPAALIAVILGIIINQIFMATGSSLALNSSQLVKLPVPQSVEDVVGLIALPDFKGFLNPQIWIVGVTIAIVASIETLLCIEASDRIDPKRRITDTNLELRAQGIGNVISSFIGGLPMTSVVVRSSANVNAGATSKMSAIIHGVLLLICAITIPLLLNMIPLATLAAVLLLVGYKLAKPSMFKHFWDLGRYQFIPFLVTVIAVVFTDLLKGVGIGMLISISYILLGNLKRSYYLSREELESADEITIKLSEEVSFLNKAAIKKTLKNITPGSKVVIDARHTAYIAHDILELIQDFTNVRAKEEDITVRLTGFKTDYREVSNSHDHVIINHRRAM